MSWSGLWIVATIGAAFAQTLRNALQRDLTGKVGLVAATHVRFLFGLPFGLGFLAVATALAGRSPPLPDGVVLGWIGVGAAAQIAATALMLAAMQRRSFVVTTAFTKTEPVQVLVVASLLLGELPTPLLAGAVLVATWGVLVLTGPWGGERQPGARPAAALGLGAGGLFAVSAVTYRGGILALGGEGDGLAAVTALVLALTLQAVVLGAWLGARNRTALRGVLVAWRASLGAGFMGALASLGWFVAFALAETAAVRTLGLVELVFAQLLSRRLLNEPTNRRDLTGLLLLALGVALVLNTGGS